MVFPLTEISTLEIREVFLEIVDLLMLLLIKIAEGCYLFIYLFSESWSGSVPY